MIFGLWPKRLWCLGRACLFWFFHRLFADVADVCLRSLHEPVARNKSFEVCFEYENTAGSMYELVTQVKDAGTSSYLQPALSVLEQNT